MITYMINEARPSPNKQESCYQTIRERILAGTYGPGYRLVIDALSREFGTSPIPVREAIRRLEAEGLVEYQANTGARVTAVDEQAFAEALSLLALLEGHATALAAPHVSPDDCAHLRRLNRAMEQALAAGDRLRMGDLNRQFHFVIYQRCPNAYLTETIGQTWRRLDALRRTVFLYIPERGRESVDEHEAIVGMLETGATAADIEAYVREHKLHTVRAFHAWKHRPE